MLTIIYTFTALLFISELVLFITKNSRRKQNVKRKDRMSMLLFWLVIPLSLVIGFSYAQKGAWETMNYAVAVAGLIISLLGSVIRWGAIIQLAQAFTVDVAISADQKLNTKGFYSKVRHPSYSGVLLNYAGLALAMNSWISFCIIFFPVFLVTLNRMNIEEKVLSEAFGKEYDDYKQQTKRIIPFVY